MDRKKFEQLVAEALASIPRRFKKAMHNIAIVVEDEPSPDDPLIEGSNLVGAPLVARLLGGTVIEEQVDEPR